MTHPTQGLLDMYTALRALKKPFEDMRIIISTPDLSRARSGQSFALGAARMGAHIIYTGSSGLRTPQVLIDKLKSMGASFEEHFDLTHDENVELMARADLLYLPGSSLKKEDPNREDFMRKVANHYLYLNDLEYIKKKTGRVVGIMHSLPRNDFEFEQSLDKSEFEPVFQADRVQHPTAHGSARVHLRRELALYGRCGAVSGGLPPRHVSVRPASGPVAHLVRILFIHQPVGPYPGTRHREKQTCRHARSQLSPSGEIRSSSVRTPRPYRISTGPCASPESIS